MYVINDYQLKSFNFDTFIFSDSKAAKISHPVLSEILLKLQTCDKQEVSEAELFDFGKTYGLSLETLKNVLINQLDILRPLSARKFSSIYIDSNDGLVSQLLQETFQTQYHVYLVEDNQPIYTKGSLVIFYRTNYSSVEFKALYQHLPDDVYLITAGVLHTVLAIDNLYFNGSGLPTHVSNLQQLAAFLKSDLPATKDNWLLFYRSMLLNKVDEFPEPKINACQKAFVAYALYQFASQYTHFWKAPTTLDKINWFWHVDLTSFNVHQEVAVHSTFSEYDMKLNLSKIKQPELI